MPTPENLTLQVSVNAGPQQTGAITVLNGDTLVLSPANPSGITSLKYEIYGYPPNFTVPADWSTAADGVFYIVTGGEAAPTITYPASATVWGKLLFRGTANNAERNNAPAPDLIDERTAVQVLSPNGLKDVAYLEAQQFGGTMQWARPLQETLRALETMIGGGGMTRPSNPGEDGRVAIASAGDLVYLAGTVAGQVLKWSGTAWAAAALTWAQTLATPGARVTDGTGANNPQISLNDALELGGLATQKILGNVDGVEYHVPTGDTHEWFINNASVLALSSTIAAFAQPISVTSAGAAVATAGHIRLPTEALVYARNGTDTANLRLLWATGTTLHVGDESQIASTHIRALTNINGNINNTNVWITRAGQLELQDSNQLDWVTSAALSINNTTWLTSTAALSSFAQSISITSAAAAVASAGTIRVLNVFSLSGRNNGNTADIGLLSLNASDAVTLGDATNGGNLNLNSSSTARAIIGANTVWITRTTSFEMQQPTISFAAAVTTPTHTQIATGSAAGQNTIYEAQGNNATLASGFQAGAAILRGGANAGTGYDGDTILDTQGYTLDNAGTMRGAVKLRINGDLVAEVTKFSGADARLRFAAGSYLDFAGASELDIMTDAEPIFSTRFNSGNLVIVPAKASGANATRNIALWGSANYGSATNFQGGQRVLQIANAVTVPTGDPASGALYWLASGALVTRTEDSWVEELGFKSNDGGLLTGGSWLKRADEGQLAGGAGATTVLSIAIADETSVTAILTATLRDATANQSAGYVRIATYKRDAAGALTIVGTVTDVHVKEDDAAWDATIGVSGNDLIVSVTPDAANATDYLVCMEVQRYTP